MNFPSDGLLKWPHTCKRPRSSTTHTFLLSIHTQTHSTYPAGDLSSVCNEDLIKGLQEESQNTERLGLSLWQQVICPRVCVRVRAQVNTFSSPYCISMNINLNVCNIQSCYFNTNEKQINHKIKTINQSIQLLDSPLSIHSSTYQYTTLSIIQTVVHLSTDPSVYLFVSIQLHPAYLFIHSISPSAVPFIHPSLNLSKLLRIHVGIHPSIHSTFLIMHPTIPSSHVSNNQIHPLIHACTICIHRTFYSNI